MQPDWSTDLRLALWAVWDACGENNPWSVPPRDVQAKGLSDLVTALDRETEARLTAYLRSNNRHDEIIGEEGTRYNGTTGRRWIVDPLDATTAFVLQAGADVPSIMVALQCEGVTTLGIVHFPLSNTTYCAELGHGAWRNQVPFMVTPPTDQLSEAWVELNAYLPLCLETPQITRLRDRLRGPNVVRLLTTSVPHSGLAVRMASQEMLLAAIVHDNNPKQVKQELWDVAAPSLIMQQAGGCVLSLRGTPYDPFHPEPFVMATSLTLAEQIIELAR